MEYQTELPITQGLGSTRSLDINAVENAHLKTPQIVESLQQVRIRFDTSPRFYTKSDYTALLSLIDNVGGTLESKIDSTSQTLESKIDSVNTKATTLDNNLKSAKTSLNSRIDTILKNLPSNTNLANFVKKSNNSSTGNFSWQILYPEREIDGQKVKPAAIKIKEGGADHCIEILADKDPSTKLKVDNNVIVIQTNNNNSRIQADTSEVSVKYSGDYLSINDDRAKIKHSDLVNIDTTDFRVKAPGQVTISSDTVNTAVHEFEIHHSLENVNANDTETRIEFKGDDSLATRDGHIKLRKNSFGARVDRNGVLLSNQEGLPLSDNTYDSSFYSGTNYVLVNHEGVTIKGDRITIEGNVKEGLDTESSDNVTHVEGKGSKALNDVTHAEGLSTTASGRYSHSEGNNTLASGENSHAENELTKAIGVGSHAEGIKTEARGSFSHAEGIENVISANAEGAHVEGRSNHVNASFSHAEGDNTTVNGTAAHAEGMDCRAEADYSHAQGENCRTYANSSFAGGKDSETKESAFASFAYGEGVVTNGLFQTALGHWNVPCDNSVAFVIGNGINNENRSNAFAVKTDGTLCFWRNGSSVELTPSAVAGLSALEANVLTLIVRMNEVLTSNSSIIKPVLHLDLNEGCTYKLDSTDLEINETFVNLFENLVDGYEYKSIIALPYNITEVVSPNDEDPRQVYLYDVTNPDDFTNSHVLPWYNGQEYVIRIICTHAALLIFPEEIRWTPSIENNSIVDFPAFDEGFTYDIHILNGIATWSAIQND